MTDLKRAFLKLNRGILRLPLPWRAWNLLLAFLNGVAPLLFLRHLEAQLVWAAFAASFVFMTALCAFSGFSRLLGLGHVFWIPLLWFLWAHLDQIPATDPFGVWIRLLMALNAVSLVIDAVEVIRYFGGDRSEPIEGL